MAVAFVLISTDPLENHNVYNNLHSHKNITDVYTLFGEYDIIAKIEVNSFEEIGKIVINDIRTNKGVLDTKTLTGLVHHKI